MRDFLAGTIDLAILSSLENLEPFRTRRVASEAHFLISPRKGHLSMAKSTRVAAIDELALVLTARPNSMRLIVDRALYRHNLAEDRSRDASDGARPHRYHGLLFGLSVFSDRPSLERKPHNRTPIEKLNICWTIATARDRHESAAMHLFADEMIAESRRKIQDSEWLSAVSNAR